MVVAFIALLAAVAAATPFVERQSSLSSFINKERLTALDGAIANIGGSRTRRLPRHRRRCTLYLEPKLLLHVDTRLSIDIHYAH